MAQVMIQNQRQLEMELFHNQAAYPAKYAEMFSSPMTRSNNCPITHALRAEPVICNDCVNTFWNTSNVNRLGANGAGAIEATVQKKEIIITKAIIREVLRHGDQPHFPTSLEQRRVLSAFRRMSYEGGYPIVLKKLYPPYWRLLVHIFLQSIVENKGGYDQLNKGVNEWDYKFSAFFYFR
ncbi:hypothetical protein Hdeb2414_s0016g00497451 [Helianthus debilis subsp. tardiflorus]